MKLLYVFHTRIGSFYIGKQTGLVSLLKGLT